MRELDEHVHMRALDKHVHMRALDSSTSDNFHTVEPAEVMADVYNCHHFSWLYGVKII